MFEITRNLEVTEFELAGSNCTFKILSIIFFALEHCSSVPLKWTWSSLMINSLTPLSFIISSFLRPLVPIISPILSFGICITSSWQSVLTALSYQLSSPWFRLLLRGLPWVLWLFGSVPCSESRDMAATENRQFRKTGRTDLLDTFTIHHVVKPTFLRVTTTAWEELTFTISCVVITLLEVSLGNGGAIFSGFVLI